MSRTGSGPQVELRSARPPDSAAAEAGETSTDPPKSEPRLTGPKRRSAGVVVLRRFDGEWRCLLLRCYRYWDFPRGEIEPGEDPLPAARREVAEETSLQTSTFAGV